MKQAVESRMSGLKAFSEALVSERLARHEAFMDTRLRDGGKAYLSRAYGFPVVTAQETEINIPRLKGIDHAGEKFTVTYEP
jgi:hypothetical protein